MSRSPTGPEEVARQLSEEGFDAALLQGMLHVRDVPYLAEDGCVARGGLLIPMSRDADFTTAPPTHAVWWTGGQPCEADGSRLRAVNVVRDAAPRAAGLPPAATMCAKPHGREFRDFRELIRTYAALVGGPVAEVDPTATARTRSGHVPVDLVAGPFAYLDTASPRVGLGHANAAIEGTTIGIVGLGGTGSFVLDLVSKCGVDAIHLFDDDAFEQHSAFRAPGAAGIDELRARRSKVDHFARVYRRIHRRVVPHAVRMGPRTMPLLDLLDFAFVCIDDAAAKPAIMEGLARRGIAYVDVGMGLHSTERGIAGAVRTTLVPAGGGPLADRVPTVGDPEGVYATNIQVCELNALNASLAVIAWKRHTGFYLSSRAVGNSVFVVEDGRLHSEVPG